VGTAAPYDIYIYDGTSKSWRNNGVMQGEAGEGVIPHGAAGQVLMKASGTDYDTKWGDIALRGDDAPTTYTKAEYVGQFYIANDGQPYDCTSIITASDGETTYTWHLVLIDGITSTFTAVIPSTGWTNQSGYVSQTVAVPGLPGNAVKYDVDIDRSVEMSADERIAIKSAWGGLLAAKANEGGVYFEFEAVPEVEIPIKMGVSVK
jgi:hypothetical protein